jgi:hypothetical protein
MQSPREGSGDSLAQIWAEPSPQIRHIINVANCETKQAVAQSRIATVFKSGWDGV